MNYPAASSGVSKTTTGKILRPKGRGIHPDGIKRSKVPLCLRRSGYAQAGVKVSQHTQLPFGTFFMQLVGLEIGKLADQREE